MKPGPKKLPAALRRKKLQVVIEPAVRQAVARLALARNLSMSAAARLALVTGLRAYNQGVDG